MNMVGKKCSCSYYDDIDMISNLMQRFVLQIQREREMM